MLLLIYRSWTKKAAAPPWLKAKWPSAAERVAEGQTQRAKPAQGRANSEPRSIAAAAPLYRAAAGPKNS